MGCIWSKRRSSAELPTTSNNNESGFTAVSPPPNQGSSSAIAKGGSHGDTSADTHGKHMLPERPLADGESVNASKQASRTVPQGVSQSKPEDNSQVVKGNSSSGGDHTEKDMVERGEPSATALLINSEQTKEPQPVTDDNSSSPKREGNKVNNGEVFPSQKTEQIPSKEDLVKGEKEPTQKQEESNNALDLTAAASNALLQNRRNPWVQLSGHADSFAPAGPHTVWKRRMGSDTMELEAYRKLSQDCARLFAPRFYREVPYNDEHFIELEDLLQNFQNPFVMDVKMGTRTFLESEVSNDKPRPDLYEKMVKLCPDEPTEEEKKAKAITKLRYMQFRENESSSSSLGFRIDAMKREGDPEALKKMKTAEEVTKCVAEFLQENEGVRVKMLTRLKDMRVNLQQSDFFEHHEIIGSSLLFLFDSEGEAGVWMIDFAKSSSVEGMKLNHRDPWVLGNREDGYLVGLDNLISIFSALDFKKTPL